jgi:hypothetical protein
MKKLNPVIYILGFAECTQNLILVLKGWKGFTIFHIYHITGHPLHYFSEHGSYIA